MGKHRLDVLHLQLSDLRARQRRGEKVQSEVDKILAEIDDLEKPAIRVKSQLPPTSNNSRSSIDMDVEGDVIGGAFGTNASVQADVITKTYNPQSFSSTTHRHEHYGSASVYEPHPAQVEVIAGNIVAAWFQRAFNAAPQGVSVGLATVLPLLLLFSHNTTILGVIGLITLTPLGVFVLLKTSFMRIPREAYRDDKFLYYSSLVMSGTGVLSVILFVIGYYLAMAVLSAMMGAVREQIYRR